MVSKVRNFWLCVFSGVVAVTLIACKSWFVLAEKSIPATWCALRGYLNGQDLRLSLSTKLIRHSVLTSFTFNAGSAEWGLFHLPLIIQMSALPIELPSTDHLVNTQCTLLTRDPWELSLLETRTWNKVLSSTKPLNVIGYSLCIDFTVIIKFTQVYSRNKHGIKKSLIAMKIDNKSHGPQKLQRKWHSDYDHR